MDDYSMEYFPEDFDLDSYDESYPEEQEYYEDFNYDDEVICDE